MKQTAYCEIVIPLQHDLERHWPPVHEERLYARALGEASYCLENIPYFALGVSKGDIVRAFGTGLYPVMEQVLEHKGSSTLRVMTDEHEAGALLEVAAAMQSMDCVSERHPTLPLLAVPVPSATDITNIYDWLETGAASGRWDYEVGFDFIAYWTHSIKLGHRVPFPD